MTTGSPSPVGPVSVRHRRRADRLYLRHHRAAEGRDVDPRQPDRRLGRNDRAGLGPARRRRDPDHDADGASHRAGAARQRVRARREARDHAALRGGGRGRPDRGRGCDGRVAGADHRAHAAAGDREASAGVRIDPDRGRDRRGVSGGRAAPAHGVAAAGADLRLLFADRRRLHGVAVAGGPRDASWLGRAAGADPSRSGSSTRACAMSRPASPAKSWCAAARPASARSCAATTSCRRRTPRPSSTAGCAPAMSAASTPTASSISSTAPRT